MWNFKGTLWNSTQNILLIHWKIRFLYNIGILRALRFKSSYAFLKRPPGNGFVLNSWHKPRPSSLTHIYKGPFYLYRSILLLIHSLANFSSCAASHYLNQCWPTKNQKHIVYEKNTHDIFTYMISAILIQDYSWISELIVKCDHL